jgi:hypothetical protein
VNKTLAQVGTGKEIYHYLKKLYEEDCRSDAHDEGAVKSLSMRPIGYIEKMYRSAADSKANSVSKRSD